MSEFDQRSQHVEQQWNAGRDIVLRPPSDNEIQKRRYRDWLLARIQQRQSDFFANSLHGATLVELGLHQRAENVSPTGELVLQLISDSSENPLPPGTHIIDIYKQQARERLLILGAPGAGKTTTLVELGREILAQAEEDDTRPIPVIFHLPSWSVDRLPLSDWLVQTLKSMHFIRLNIAQAWIENDRIALLLDGLNEVQKEYRPACIRAINEFMNDHGAASIAICCREADYFAQTERLTVENTVVIQPLKTEQINEYLFRGGEQLEAVRTLLHNDPALLEMARTPLMLGILTLTYAGKSVQDIPMTDISKTRQEVLKDYVTAMLQRRQAHAHYTPQQTTRWLAWLAHRLEQHHQTEFQLENIQPDWLEGKQRPFYNVAVKCCSMFICTLLALLGGWLLSLLIDWSALRFDNSWSVGKLLFYQNSENGPGGAFLGLLFGGIIGLLVGLIHHVEREIKPVEVIHWSWRNMRQNLAKLETLRWGFLIGLFVALCIGLTTWNASHKPINSLYSGLVGLLVGLPIGQVSSIISNLLAKTQKKLPDMSPGQKIKYSVRNRVAIGCIGGLTIGLISGLGFGSLMEIIDSQIEPENSHILLLLVYWLLFGLPPALLAGLIIGLVHRVRKDVQTLEIISWLKADIWREFMRSDSFKYMLVTGISFGSVYEFADRGPWYFALLFGIALGLICGLIFEFINGCLGGLSSSLLDERQRIKPGQGMHSSVRNSIFIGLVSFVVGGIFFGLFTGLLNGFSQVSKPLFAVFSGLLNGTFFALIAGLFIGLAYGGAAYIQHIVLRGLLWYARCIPWNYVPFLNYANDHVLLTRLGGRYLFIHPLLRAYFMSLEEVKSAPSQEVAPVVCTCGCPTRPGARFCPNCGKPVQSS